MKAISKIIDGAVGPLEILYELPDDKKFNRPHSVVVVCHPHPLFQGTLHNKVAYMLARSQLENGSIAVRFNFRGVGNSIGEHADGIGEVDDVLAVFKWVKLQWPDLPVNLAGFSFGSYVSLLVVQNPETMSTYNIQNLITVAPPVGRWSFDDIQAPKIPWLVIQGKDDDLVDAQAVSAWCDELKNPDYFEIEGADHFFHGKLGELREIIQDWKLKVQRSTTV